MKKIIVLMLALVSLLTVQAQKRVLPDQQKNSRDRIIAEKLKFSEEQKQKAKVLNEDYRKKMAELRKKDDILVKDWKNQMMELNKKAPGRYEGFINQRTKSPG